MPIPRPNLNESQENFISRFMAVEAMQKEFPEEKQRLAIAGSTWESAQKKGDSLQRNLSIRLDMKQDALQATPEGYLFVDGFLTRAGVFDYYDDQGKLTRELRPGEEVFDFESLKTLQLQPVTNLHPDEMITPQNIKDFQIGITGEVISRQQNQDGDFVQMKIKITDPAVIKQIKDRRDAGLPVELSCGYDARMLDASGDYNGEHYDAIQTYIRYNHVSLVPAGRAGEHVKLKFDKSQLYKKELKVMKFKKKAIKMDAFNMDEINVEVPDESYPHIEKLANKIDEAVEIITDQTTALTEANQKLDEAKTEIETKTNEATANSKKADEAQGKLDQMTEELKKAKEDAAELTNPESPRVRAMLKAKDVMEKTAGKLKVDMKDKDPKTIRIDIIKAVSSEFKSEDKTDEYINARYDSVVEMLNQAEESKNDWALGSFIKQAHDIKDKPEDPRAAFIAKSDELAKKE